MRLSPEDELAQMILHSRDIPTPERQFLYAEGRKLRADFAWPEHRLLLEAQGGVYTRQAHGSITGILADIDRSNAAVLNGWRMLRVTPEMVRSGQALELIRAAMDRSV